VTHETRYAKTADGVYLAYQVVGSGPLDVVMDLHAFAGNVDLIWDEPDWGPAPFQDDRVLAPDSP
jgi:hypothetical protein